MRNLFATVPKGAREAIAAVLRTIFAQAAALLEDAAEDILAYRHLLLEHQRQLRSTNRHRPPLRLRARPGRHPADESRPRDTSIWRGAEPAILQSAKRAPVQPGAASTWTQYAVRHQLPVQLDAGLTAPQWWPTSLPTPH